MSNQPYKEYLHRVFLVSDHALTVLGFPDKAKSPLWCQDGAGKAHGSLRNVYLQDACNGSGFQLGQGDIPDVEGHLKKWY